MAACVGAPSLDLGKVIHRLPAPFLLLGSASLVLLYARAATANHNVSTALLVALALARVVLVLFRGRMLVLFMGS